MIGTASDDSRNETGQLDPTQDGTPDLGRSIELVREAQIGNQRALNELFERYQSRVHRIASIRMGHRIRSFMDSVDLVQNTCLVAARKIQSFEPRTHGSIINWLSRILENQIRDAADYANAEKRNRDREVPIAASSSTTTPSIPVESPDPLPLQSLEKAELRKILDACVGQLEAHHREVILLRDYACGSWASIAEVLDRPSAHAAQELHRRARIKLSRLVAKRIALDGSSRL